MNLRPNNETLIGAFAVIIIALMFFGFNFLKGNDVFSGSNTYYVVFDDVSGLKPSNPVQVHGLGVGTVTKLTMHPDDPNKILAVIKVNSDVVIDEKSIVQIASSDLLGSKMIELVLAKGGKKAYANKDTIYGTMEKDLFSQVGTEILPVKAKTEKLLGSIDSLILIAQGLLSDDGLEGGMGSIQRTVKHLENTSGNIDKLMEAESKNIAAIVQNLNAVTENIKKNNDNITKITANTAAFTDQLAKTDLTGTIAELKKSIGQINGLMADINSGKGTLGALMKDKTLYDNLNKSITDLEKVLDDLYKNPKIYLSPLGKNGKKAAKMRKKNP